MLRHASTLATLLLALILSAASEPSGAAAAARALRTLAPGERLPDVPMSGLNGPNRGLASYVGRPLVINVWASWCGPCRAEAASLERFAWSAKGSRYTVIGVSTDDDRAAAKAWLRHSNATLNHYIDHALVLETLLGASTIPMTVLVDAQGRVVTRVRGARDWDAPQNVALIEAAFARAPGNR